MRLLGERSTSVKKGAFKTALSLFNICQLEKQIEEIEKLWVEEGGRLTVSCLGSQVKKVSRKKEEVSCEVEDQVFAVEVQQYNTVQFLSL